MITFNAILTDECGDEFSATVQAADMDAAWDQLREDYPESSVVEVFTGAGRREMERKNYFYSLGEEY